MPSLFPPMGVYNAQAHGCLHSTSGDAARDGLKLESIQSAVSFNDDTGQTSELQTSVEKLTAHSHLAVNLWQHSLCKGGCLDGGS